MPQTEGEKLQSLTTVGTLSYVLHLVVAVGALVQDITERAHRGE